MTHSEKAPTAEQVTMARQVYADYGAAKALEAGDMVDDAWKAAVLDGDADKSHGVRIALAAIIETTEAARTLALAWRDENKVEVADGDTSPADYQIRGARIEMNAFAGALKRGDHLKGPQS